MNRERFNKYLSDSVLDLVKYQNDDYRADNDYLEYKPRDIFKAFSNPPYIAYGLVVSQNTDPLKVDITPGTAFTSEFVEINAESATAFPMFDITSGVINYLTLEYDTEDIISSTKQAFKNNAVSYISKVEDSYRYQWKLASAINPEQTGSIVGPFDIIKDYNDRIRFSTDQSNPEYTVLFTPSVASISSATFSSGNVDLTNGVNDTFIFIVDSFTYTLDLTSLATENLTLSGLVTRINSLAFLANGLLTDPIAFTISGENRIRITSPRDGAPFAGKKVEILNGNANATLGFTNGTLSSEAAPRTAQNLADEINFATVPEITASAPSGRLKVFAQNPIGYLSIQSIVHNIYDTVGLTEITIYGAQAINFSTDIILASAQNINNQASLDTTLRTKTVKLFDVHAGWEQQQTVGVLSGEPDDITVTIQSGEYYIVGSNELEVYANGARLYQGKGFDEIGSHGAISTQFYVYNVLSGHELMFRVPKGGAAQHKQLAVQEDSSTIVTGTEFLDFGTGFIVTKSGNNKAQINLEIISGDPMIGSGVVLADHASLHEYGGSMEIDVTNLTGLLLHPQKSNVYVDDALLYSTRGFNFKGNRLSVTDSGSGFVNIEVGEKVFTDDAGDAIIRLGFDGGTVFPYILLQDQFSGIWTLSVNNDGQLITEQTGSGSPLNLILESETSGILYNINVENIVGSGELTTQLVTSGTPLLFSLEAPNGKGWGIRVTDDGILYTLDPDNIFAIENGDGDKIFIIKENGIAFLHQFNANATSGDIDYLPAADSDNSGGIALYMNSSGNLSPIFSDGTNWFKFELTPLIP